MASPLYKQFGNQSANGMFGNMQNMMQQFNQFRQTFQGDPKQQVQQLLNSGRMSQSQFNQLKQMADQFMKMMPK